MGKHSAPKGAGRGNRRRQATRPYTIDRLDPKGSISAKQTNAERRRPIPRERARRHKKRKRVALGCLAGLVIFVMALAVVGFVYVRNINANLQGGFQSDEAADAALDEVKPEKRDEPFYMIIMGVDSREVGEASRSDTLILARIDPPQQRITLLSIPRDTRVSIPGHGTQKINAAHSFGGPALVIETVRNITGLSISHYMEVDFQGFKDVVDALGGVTVDVPEDIYDMKAANHVKSAARLDAGLQVLDGAHALTFVRSRAFPLGDLQRIQNQQIFLKALLKEALKAENVFRLPSVVTAMSESVTTDMSVGDLLRITNQMKGMDEDALETVTMPGEPKMIGSGSYVIMDEEAFAEMVDRISQGLSAEPTPAEEPTPLPSSISVTIRNGAGISGVAAEVSGRLNAAGFSISEVGNANQFVYDQTLVVYEDDERLAQMVLDSLGMGRLVPSRGMYAFSTDVLVVVGKDWEAPIESNAR